MLPGLAWLMTIAVGQFVLRSVSRVNIFSLEEIWHNSTRRRAEFVAVARRPCDYCEEITDIDESDRFIDCFLGGLAAITQPFKAVWRYKLHLSIFEVPSFQRANLLKKSGCAYNGILRWWGTNEVIKIDASWMKSATVRLIAWELCWISVLDARGLAVWEKDKCILLLME